ncbi:hypothetical protein, partial [Escherichia coli]|uniref:hypothetical protein n=1 Tax=Escherichia coli TaxID=562 RepID=UPI00196683EC
AYGPQNDVTLKMPAFEWVHVQLHQQKGMISLSPPTICNSAIRHTFAFMICNELINNKRNSITKFDINLEKNTSMCTTQF